MAILVQKQDTTYATAPGRQAGLFIATEGPDLTTKRNRNFVLLVLSLFPEFRWGSQTSAETEASEKQGIRVRAR